MKTFEIDIYEGHCLLKDGSNIILVDTGAPKTIHLSPNLEFLGTFYQTTTNFEGKTIERLSDLLGTPITTLMGVDILRDFKILFNYKNKSISFTNNDFNFNGIEKSISSFMGIPIIELEIEGSPLKFFLDTGAKLSYLLKKITKNHQSVGIEEDFYPGLGKFTTDSFLINTQLDNDIFTVKYGIVPKLLEATLKTGRTNGIIGFDFFNNFKIMLDLSLDKLIYHKQNN